MRKTKERNSETKIAVDLELLAAMLSCGESTARQIGADAQARIYIGRRVLYSVSKVSAYIDAIAIWIDGNPVIHRIPQNRVLNAKYVSKE